MSEAEFVPFQYTRMHAGEIRRQMRDALEKFELPESDLPPPGITADGLLIYTLPYAAKLAFDAVQETLDKDGTGIAARDAAALSLTLVSGTVLEFWPTAEGTARLECRGISDADDAASGRRFRELLGIIGSLDSFKETLRDRAQEMSLDAREEALEKALGPSAMADLARAIAALKGAGLGVVLQTSAEEPFLVKVSRPLGYTQSFTSLDGFLTFARHVEPTATDAPTKGLSPTPARTSRRTIVTSSRRPTTRSGIVTWLLLIVGLALLALLFFYPWPF